MSEVVRAFNDNALRVLREVTEAIAKLTPAELLLARAAAEDTVMFLSNEHGAPRAEVLLADLLAEAHEAPHVG